jgi:phosphoribosylpyrophosphate synthetase
LFLKGKMLDDVVIATMSKTHSEFAQQLARFAGQTVGIEETIGPDKFTSGEFRPKFRTSVNKKRVRLVVPQSQYKYATDMIKRVEITAYSCKERGADEVTAVFTELPFARQDRTQKEIENDPKMEEEAVSMVAIANGLHANGVDRVLTMHLHSQKIYDIFEKAYDKPGREVLFDISPAPIVAHYIMTKSSLDLSDGGAKLGIVSPDKGAQKFVNDIMRLLPLPNAVHVKFDKARKVPNKPGAVTIDILNMDELKEKGFCFDNKYLCLFDDIVDTGSTKMATADWIYVANKELDHGLGTPLGIFDYFTHAVMGGQGYLDVQKNLVEKMRAIEFVTTNTHPFITDLSNQDHVFKQQSTILRVAALFGDAIINCCEKNIHPEDYYKYNSFIELNKKMDENPLYLIKRSDTHFLGKK